MFQCISGLGSSPSVSYTPLRVFPCLSTPPIVPLPETSLAYAAYNRTNRDATTSARSDGIYKQNGDSQVIATGLSPNHYSNVVFLPLTDNYALPRFYSCYPACHAPALRLRLPPDVSLQAHEAAPRP